MQIIQVTSPMVEVNDEKLPVNSAMYKDLVGFQNEIDKRERAGYTKCYFLTLNTQHTSNLDTIYWVRCRFVK
jgi:hypothetical protein